MLPKYELVDSKNSYHDDHWCVKVLDGEYEGLVYQYDTVKIVEDKDGEGAELKFNTITVENPNNIDLTLENEKNILGEILVDIIEENMEQMSENGTPDTEQSTT